MLENDRTLLKAYRAGDRRAFDRIYRALSGPVMRSLSRGFQLRGAAQVARVGVLDLDAAHQETFIRVFGESARLNYDGLSSFTSYVLAIARSAAVDVLRAQGKLMREAVALDEVDDPLPDPAADPEVQTLQAEARSLVNGFLSTLSQQDAAFAQARFVDRLSQDAAGARFGLSRQQVRTREAKLKAACVEHLSRRGYSRDATPRHLSVASMAVAMLMVLPC
jgi:RNA polymerase sigma-70 factor (ECF subfamily)